MEKINIAELLKDCPKGMELDCLMYDGLEFACIVDNDCFPIRCRIKSSNDEYYFYNFTKYGYWNNDYKAKCVIFPKGKTTWEGFQRPFKDGDILSYQCEGFKNRSIYIYMYHNRMNTSYYVALSGHSSEFLTNCEKGCALNGYDDTVRFATEEEKQKLFDAIKENGYRWNAEKKELEKLIVPKFKVGDRIRQIGSPRCYIIKTIEFDRYVLNNNQFIKFRDEHIYELLPNKFDISTLVPFESRVLVRDCESERWYPATWGLKTDDINYPYVVVGGGEYNFCIPFEGNQHLLGITNDCDEYYKTWE